MNDDLKHGNPAEAILCSCSKREFFAAIGRMNLQCVHVHTDEISGAFVVTFRAASPRGVLEFSAHPLLQPLTVDLSNADSEFEFEVPEREVKALIRNCEAAAG